MAKCKASVLDRLDVNPVSTTRACDLRQVAGFPSLSFPVWSVWSPVGWHEARADTACWQRLPVGRLGRQRHHLSPWPSPLQSSLRVSVSTTCWGLGLSHDPGSWHLGTQPRMLGSQAPPSRCPSSCCHTWAPACFCQGQRSTPLLPALGIFPGRLPARARHLRSPRPLLLWPGRRSAMCLHPGVQGRGQIALIPGAKPGAGISLVLFFCFILS